MGLTLQRDKSHPSHTHSTLHPNVALLWSPTSVNGAFSGMQYDQVIGGLPMGPIHIYVTPYSMSLAEVQGFFFFPYLRFASLHVRLMHFCCTFSNFFQVWFLLHFACFWRMETVLMLQRGVCCVEKKNQKHIDLSLMQFHWSLWSQKHATAAKKKKAYLLQKLHKYGTHRKIRLNDLQCFLDVNWALNLNRSALQLYLNVFLVGCV